MADGRKSFAAADQDHLQAGAAGEVTGGGAPQSDVGRQHLSAATAAAAAATAKSLSLFEQFVWPAALAGATAALRLSIEAATFKLNDGHTAGRKRRRRRRKRRCRRRKQPQSSDLVADVSPEAGQSSIAG